MFKKLEEKESAIKAVKGCEKIQSDPGLVIKITPLEKVAKHLVELKAILQDAKADADSISDALKQLLILGKETPLAWKIIGDYYKQHNQLPDARNMYLRAVEGGEASACCPLAQLYNSISDWESAAQFWRLAVIYEKNPQACESLAILYENGRGVPKDLMQAYSLYRNMRDLLLDFVLNAEIRRLQSDLSPERVMADDKKAVEDAMAAAKAIMDLQNLVKQGPMEFDSSIPQIALAQKADSHVDRLSRELLAQHHPTLIEMIEKEIRTAQAFVATNQPSNSNYFPDPIAAFRFHIETLKKQISPLIPEKERAAFQIQLDRLISEADFYARNAFQSKENYFIDNKTLISIITEINKAKANSKISSSLDLLTNAQKTLEKLHSYSLQALPKEDRKNDTAGNYRQTPR